MASLNRESTPAAANGTSPPKPHSEGFLVRGRQAVRRAWRGWRRSTGAPIAGNIAADLPDRDLALVRQQIDTCLAARGGEVSARAIAADLGRAYIGLNETGRWRFFDLLARDYKADRDALTAAAAALQGATDDATFADTQKQMRHALIPPRLRLLKQFNGLEEGVKFLVDLRADLMEITRRHGTDPEFQALNRELYELLSSWFDVGFLELRRITWEAPASLLEKLIVYEAVHEIRSWEDLKNRLDSDRRCYAFFHPSMPNEPLIFVEVALVKGMADQIQTLLDESQPAADPATADTAIFYSISNAQDGLAGVSFGDFLIKRVVSELTREFPMLKTFATLSPIPGLRAWLETAFDQGDLTLEAAQAETIGRLNGNSDPTIYLMALFEQSDWLTDDAIAEQIRPILMRLCVTYMLTTMTDRIGRKRAVDSVAHFHLSNGAQIERLNWKADLSQKGRRQSAGLMVNYLYRLSDIERNHEEYKGAGKINCAGAIKNLA